MLRTTSSTRYSPSKYVEAERKFNQKKRPLQQRLDLAIAVSSDTESEEKQEEEEEQAAATRLLDASKRVRSEDKQGNAKTQRVS